MAQDTLLGFPAHTLPYRRGKLTSLSTVSAGVPAFAGTPAVCVKSARRPFYFACFMLRLMRFFFSSTSSTTTLTTSPTDTASEGWRMNLSDT